MNRLLGGFFEATHLLGTAFLFAVAAALVFLVNPSLVDGTDLGREQALTLFGSLADAIATYGLFLAGIAAFGALLAPYLRGDKGIAVSWMRIFIACSTIMVVVWLRQAVGDEAGVPGADVEFAADAAGAEPGRAGGNMTPWNALLVLTTVNLILAAFQVNSRARSGKEK